MCGPKNYQYERGFVEAEERIGALRSLNSISAEESAAPRDDDFTLVRNVGREGSGRRRCT